MSSRPGPGSTFAQPVPEGDSPDDFEGGLELLRGPLFAHCYRMLGSRHDAEDALQETHLRAWRSFASFDSSRPLRPWLYRIATNVCLDVIAKRPRRRLPTESGELRSNDERAGEPVRDPVWIEPLAGSYGEAAIDTQTPEARYEQRETLELAFLVALQQLPGNQRAALLLCEVLGFSAPEAAEMLETSSASINSALQRARAALERHRPATSQSQLLEELGEEGVTELVDRFVEALQAGDVERLTDMLASDVSFSMPPYAAWWKGRSTVLAFVAADGASRRFVPLRINGQIAFGAFRLDPSSNRFEPELVEVLELDDSGQVSAITAFVDPDGWCDDEPPESATDMASLFEHVGLPDFLD